MDILETIKEQTPDILLAKLFFYQRGKLKIFSDL